MTIENTVDADQIERSLRVEAAKELIEKTDKSRWLEINDLGAFLHELEAAIRAFAAAGQRPRWTGVDDGCHCPVAGPGCIPGQGPGRLRAALCHFRMYGSGRP